jgi:hypothetical protein
MTAFAPSAKAAGEVEIDAPRLAAAALAMAASLAVRAWHRRPVAEPPG